MNKINRQAAGYLSAYAQAYKIAASAMLTANECFFTYATMVSTLWQPYPARLRGTAAPRVAQEIPAVKPLPPQPEIEAQNVANVAVAAVAPVTEASDDIPQEAALEDSPLEASIALPHEASIALPHEAAVEDVRHDATIGNPLHEPAVDNSLHEAPSALLSVETAAAKAPAVADEEIDATIQETVRELSALAAAPTTGEEPARPPKPSAGAPPVLPAPFLKRSKSSRAKKA